MSKKTSSQLLSPQSSVARNSLREDKTELPTAGPKVLSSRSSAARFQWLDSVKGLAVLWIVIFHCFLSYGGDLPWPITASSFSNFVQQCAGGTVLGGFFCAIEAIIAAIIQRGPQAVGVFLLFSGFGLTYSLTKQGGTEISWTQWYRRRLARLFPVYWAAHLVFLVSPFTVLHDRIDYRFLLSLLGDRIYPVDRMFFYLVPAWWFLGLLIELYIVFPLLFGLMQRVGWIQYLGICILLSSASRYVLTDLVEANGNYEMGAFFVCRLWEFATGMALGKLIGERPDETLGRLLSWKGFFAGIIFYTLGIFSYQPNFWHVFSDGLTATGLSLILIHVAYRLDRTPGLGRSLARAGVYSYGIYLLHQPYVTYAGDKLRSSSLGVFLILASALTILIALLAICFEYAVNRTVNRVLGS